jgi:hypothetical protein
MVGFRVFDVGLLIVWLVWFFRLRDDDDAQDDEGPGGGGPGPSRDDGPGGGGLRLPLGRAKAGRRVREHGRPPRLRPRRGAEPMPHPLPARVRQPAGPLAAPRRTFG